MITQKYGVYEMTTATVKTRNGTSAVSLVYCGMFAALMMIGANITAFAPFLVVGGVPITLQTFFAILAGLLLGSQVRCDGNDGVYVHRASGGARFREI